MLPSFAVGPFLPQPNQTNQTIFGRGIPPRTLLLTTGSGSVRIVSYSSPSPSIADATQSIPVLTTLHTLHSHTSSCFCLELSPTGRYLATGGSDALICLWDTTDWVCRRTLTGMIGSVRGLSFSWDGAYIVGGSDEGNDLQIVSARKPSPGS